MNAQQTAVLNDILGSTIGTSASVTAVGYEGLADTFVTVNQLVAASGGLLTTSNVLTTSLTASEWLGHLVDAVTTQVAQLNCGASPTPAPCNAGTALTGARSAGRGRQTSSSANWSPSTGRPVATATFRRRRSRPT